MGTRDGDNITSWGLWGQEERVGQSWCSENLLQPLHPKLWVSVRARASRCVCVSVCDTLCVDTLCVCLCRHTVWLVAYAHV